MIRNCISRVIITSSYVRIVRAQLEIMFSVLEVIETIGYISSLFVSKKSGVSKQAYIIHEMQTLYVKNVRYARVMAIYAN